MNEAQRGMVEDIIHQFKEKVLNGNFYKQQFTNALSLLSSKVLEHIEEFRQQIVNKTGSYKKYLSLFNFTKFLRFMAILMNRTSLLEKNQERASLQLLVS